MYDQSFSLHLTSLLEFAAEFQTQVEGIQAPMDHLAGLSGRQPQYGAFTEAWRLRDSEQAAVEEMYALLGQVKQAIAFTENVTRTVAAGYQQADQDIAAGLGYGGPGVLPASQPQPQPQPAPGYPAAGYASWSPAPGTPPVPGWPPAQPGSAVGGV